VEGALLQFLSRGDSRELFDQRTDSSRYDGEIDAHQPGRFLHVQVPPDFDHERTHSRIDVPVRGRHDASAEWAIEGCFESIQILRGLQVYGRQILDGKARLQAVVTQAGA
jgi:hypothetical protein